MGFFMEYVTDKIQRHMGDPTERDRLWEQHLRGVQRAAASAKANMLHPTKQYAFWRADKHQGKYEQNSDPALSKLPGRRVPNMSE